jgi:hypothetical protein
MFAVPSRNACAGRFGSRGRTAIASLLLAAGIAGAAGNVLAGAAPEPVCQDQDPSCGKALPLDQLSGTIDGLKASLSAIRQDLETRRGEANQPARALEELCAAPLAEAHAARDAAMSALEQFRATSRASAPQRGTLQPRPAPSCRRCASGWRPPRRRRRSSGTSAPS